MLKKYLLLLLLLPLAVFSQNKKLKGNTIRSNALNDTLQRAGRQTATVATDSVATLDMYKIISLERDTTYVDTALIIQKEYAANYLRKDNFGLLAFPNEGQTYNILDYGLVEHNPFPEFGFRAKHFAYLEAKEVPYFEVATPFTDLFYKSVLEQGQIMDALFSVNTSRNLNLFIGYKAIRSIGKYVNSISSNGVFRIGLSYNTTDKRYFLKLHFTGQDFSNQENGGITDISLFEESEEPYSQRERLPVYLTNAKSKLLGNRYFFDHTFRLSKSNPNSIVLHHQFNYENKFFEFEQPTPSLRFGEFYESSINNKTRYNRMYNLLGAAYNHEKLGLLEFYVEDYNYNYYYHTVILGQDNTIAIPNSLSDRIDTYGAKYTYKKGKWNGTALLSNSITNQSLANIDIKALYTFNDSTSVSGRFNRINKLPNNNFVLYQSDYKNYNWYNDGLKNEKINRFEFEFKTKWLNASASYQVMNDYLYFKDSIVAPERPTDIEQLFVTPQQDGNTINYFSVKANKEFRFGKFGLDNTVLYQNVQQSGNVLNVPSFLTRNTVYYTDRWFKKALLIQTGVTFQYFTKYYANGYSPVLGEFYSQDETKIGGFPLMDFFINLKIQEFRLFFKAEHFNSSFTGYNYYSAPNYPYRDFTVRFGVIWDFFS
ncbi:putative porin [Flavobacterium rhizosphaerae]|uniref:Porin n=1 Tax=Flavobacterium rhizosphaerae TaxID=3163298 RepID=A0ABW8YUJ8_9FLAO